MRKGLGLLLGVSLALLLVALGVYPAAAQESALRVYYAGPPGAVRTALSLAGVELVDQAAQADVLFLNGTIPDPVALAAQAQSGRGLVLILGPEVTAEQVGTLLGRPVALAARADALSLDRAESADLLATEVDWRGAPQVRERAILTGAGLEALVVGYESGEIVLGRGQAGWGTVLVFTPFLGPAADVAGEVRQANPQIQEWAYFNYLIYHLTMRAAGRSVLSFADYPAAPVPHAAERTVLFAILGAMLVTAAVAFVLVRRYSRAHPEALDAVVADREKYTRREAGTGWEEVGFHRPLGGFLLALMFGLVLFVPLIVYQNFILPNFILPSAQAQGLWGRVTQFFQVAWWFFDMGTSAAFIKYLSEHRVDDPRRGLLYGQLFVWWQALSGAVQVALLVALVSTVLPRSAYAIYAWSIVIHTFIQIPGFYQVFRHALTGLQRFDYAQVLDLALSVFLPILVQPVVVGLMYAWGQAHPEIGGAMGGLYGLGIAAYLAEALTFVLGLFLYRRLGYGVRVLFLAHFDRQVIWNSFRFGVFEMLGSVAWTLGQAAEIWITQVRLINYAEIWGNWVIAQNFIFAFQVLQTLYSNIMPAISEAISHGRQVLSQYYTVQGYRYGGLISAFIGAVLLAVADRFILGTLEPEFQRAAIYAIPLIIWGAVQYPSWVGDNVQLAANKPYLKAALVFGEQVIRVVLAWLLLAQFQINALIIAYFVGLLTKDIVAYFVNHRTCFPQRFYFWQSLGAPLLAGAAHYGVVRGLGTLFWQGDQVTSLLLFLFGILLSFPLFAFFYGLFGGWDDGTLEELRQAVDLSGFMRPLAWVFYKSTALGARLSPLHGRFPIDIRPAALEEARALTAEKVQL